MHFGTFGSKRQVEKGLEMLINEEFDMFVFSGNQSDKTKEERALEAMIHELK